VLTAEKVHLLVVLLLLNIRFIRCEAAAFSTFNQRVTLEPIEDWSLKVCTGDAWDTLIACNWWGSNWDCRTISTWIARHILVCVLNRSRRTVALQYWRSQYTLSAPIIVSSTSVIGLTSLWLVNTSEQTGHDGLALLDVYKDTSFTSCVGILFPQAFKWRWW